MTKWLHILKGRSYQIASHMLERYQIELAFAKQDAHTRRYPGILAPMQTRLTDRRQYTHAAGTRPNVSNVSENPPWRAFEAVEQGTSRDLPWFTLRLFFGLLLAPDAGGDFCGFASFPLLAPFFSITSERTLPEFPLDCDVALSSSHTFEA